MVHRSERQGTEIQVCVQVSSVTLVIRHCLLCVVAAYSYGFYSIRCDWGQAQSGYFLLGSSGMTLTTLVLTCIIDTSEVWLIIILDDDLRSLTSCLFCIISLHTLLENSTDRLLVISLLF